MKKEENEEEEEVLKCNCKKVEVGERMEERQVICCTTHHFAQNQANKIYDIHFCTFEHPGYFFSDTFLPQVRRKTCGSGGPGGGVYAGNGQKVGNKFFSKLIYVCTT